MVNTSPRDLPTTENTSRELRASVENPGDGKIVQNRQDSDIKMATSGHVNPPIHEPETTNLPPTTAVSPLKHLPSELPASAKNLAASCTSNQAEPDTNNMEGVPSTPSPTKLPPATSPAATSHTVLTSLSKRKKKRSNKSLSCHGRGRKAEAVKSEGPKNVFPAPREVSSSLPPDPPSHGSVQPPPLALQIKSLRNKKDYERRKTQRAEQAVEHLKDELLTAKNNISFLEMTNKHDSLEVSCLKDSAEKSVLLLARRTDRFVAYRARKEEEIKSLKAQAEKKIAALAKQHKFVLVREQAERYRMERAHLKEMVSKTMEISGAQRAKE